MIRESIPYTTREAWLAERAKDITSTDVAALFGVSPYLTRWELWHRKVAGDVEPDDIGAVERVQWGKRLEYAIACGAAEERGFCFLPMDEYIRIPAERIGASFDFVITDGDDPARPIRRAILECKNVDSLAFRNGWAETEFGLEAPAHIELQVQHQMLVSGIHKCYIAALVGGNRLVILERDYDPAVGDAILRECAAFWTSGEPVPDFHRDADLIRRLSVSSVVGKTIEADDRIARLLAEYDEQRRIEAVARDEKEARQAEILTLIGDADKVLADGYRLSCGTVKAVEVKAHVRASRRGFTVTKLRGDS